MPCRKLWTMDGEDQKAKKHPRDWVEQDEKTPTDGRTARAHRTRQAVAEALLSLIEGGQLRPTSKAIAERAGVSERTIFQHFEDLDTLFRVAADRLGERIVRRMAFVSDEGPLGERIDGYLRELSSLNESMTPIRRASRLHEPFSPVLTSALGSLRENRRRGIRRVFAQEIDRMADRSEQHQAVESIALIASWSSWDNMRHNSGYSIDEAMHVMEFAIRAVLAPRSTSAQSFTPPEPI